MTQWVRSGTDPAHLGATPFRLSATRTTAPARMTHVGRKRERTLPSPPNRLPTAIAKRQLPDADHPPLATYVGRPRRPVPSTPPQTQPLPVHPARSREGGYDPTRRQGWRAAALGRVTQPGMGVSFWERASAARRAMTATPMDQRPCDPGAALSKPQHHTVEAGETAPPRDSAALLKPAPPFISHLAPADEPSAHQPSRQPSTYPAGSLGTDVDVASSSLGETPPAFARAAPNQPFAHAPLRSRRSRSRRSRSRRRSRHPCNPRPWSPQGQPTALHQRRDPGGS